MKRKFTLLIAALALLTMIVQPGRAWGQTTATYSLTPDQTSTGSSATSYITTLTEFTYEGVTWKMNQWNPKTLQVKTNQGSAASEFRFYNSSAFAGRITQVVITFSSLTVTDATGFKFIGGSSEISSTTGGTAGTWNSTSKTITWTPGASDNFTYFAFYQNGKVASGSNYLAAEDAIVVTYETGGSTTPSITASNVDIAYDATNGSIAYEINNPVSGGELSAALTTGDWLTVGTVGETVPFTCSANPASAERSATVTLTYTYNTTETVTKNVTVTQAGNPNVVYTTIPELFTAATTTETNVYVTFDNWVVSGVSTNGKNVYVTDNNGNGFIMYYTSDMSSTFSAGSILSGVNVSCTLKLYNGAAELLNVVTADLTITTGGTVTPASIAMADLTGVNTGTLLHYENLTCTSNNNKYFLTDGTTSIQLYNSLYDFTNPTVGNTYNITGVYAQYNNTKEIMPRNANDLVEVVLPTVDTPTFNPAAGTYTSVQSVTIACATEGATIYYTTNGNNPTTSSTQYTGPIEVAETKTIKAIAVKEGMNDSEIATAAYTINLPVPTITVTPAEVDVIAAGVESTLTATYTNIGDVEDILADVAFYESDGTTSATYGWITANIKNDDNTVVEYLVEENEGASRTAYFKVYGTTDGEHFTYSNLVTINQAAPTYAVTFDVDGGTFVPNADFATINEEKTAGTYNLPSATKAGWDFAGWNDGTTTYEANAEYTVSAAVAFTAQWTEITTGSIVFGNNGTKINEASVTGDDSFGNTWTITTVGTTSFTQNAAYSQVGSSGSPATTITFTTTLAQSTMFTAFSAKFGGFSGTAGTVTLKVGETTVGSGSLSGGSDVIIENTSSATGTVLTVTVTGISKGVKCYYISYTISTGSDPMIIAQNSIDLSSTDTYGEFDYSIVNPGTGQLTASSTDGWISNINVTAEKVTFVTTPNTSTTDNREGTITLSYPNAANKNVTVTQSKVDYATIPFTFTGGKNAIETTAGLTENGLGNDYSSTANLRFDDTGDWVVLHLNEAPVSLSYDIKGNSFTSGSFAVQYSSNGTDYNTKVTYTKADITNSVKTFTIIDFPNETKYIRWIFTKSTGNVGFGNIHASTEYDTYGDVTIDSDALATHSVTVHSGSVVTFVGTNTNADKLVIEDGGQLIHTGDVAATLLKDYKATTWPNTKSVSGWYTIASPVDGANVSVVTTTANYDFYAYDEANYTWRNEKVPANGITTFEQGVGYLYATSADKQGSFAGTMKATNAEVEKDLSYECTLANMKGFNLMGNPFTRNLTSGDVKLGDSYLTNYFVVEGGSELVAREIATYPIKPGQGFMVQATAENQKLVFNPSTAKGRSTNNGHISIAVGNESFNDMAYINIANGNTLRKMTLNTDSPKVYVMNNNKDYAAARVENLSASMPVCFQTKNIGTYTITVKANELDVEYLHLIDNVLHEDIDLLLEPSYSFIASGHDNAARFTLVFKANANIDEIEANDIFAYQNGSDIIVNGNGELQVFDATGRMVMNTQVNGIQTVNIPATGMYIFRMVGDEVKTQKIVVR